jgi:hypothetical protein
MSDKVQPALTPEEWELYLGPREDWELSGNPTQYAHGAAAVLLHGQPFGFTWKDVDLLRGVANYWHPQDGDGAEWDEYAGRQAALRNLADRIAALLPPRP